MSRLEETLALLMTKMDQQSEQLQQLTSQQAERVDGVVEKLEQTGKHVNAIAEDLDSVKSLVQERLDTMEKSVTSMRVIQDELGERQKILKAELRSELLRDLSTSTTPLRPTAPHFIPVVEGHGESRERATSPGDRDEGGVMEGATSSMTSTASSGRDTGTSRTHLTTPTSVQKPAPFDGKMTWDAYHTQFEMLAQINHWSDVEKAAYLAISLRGPAAMVLTNLQPDQRQDYTALTTALQSRFGTAHQTELNRMRLKARIRRREETLPELAEDVERLVRLAYPEATSSMVEVLAKDHFVDSLPDEDMRLRIRQHRPSTLRAALETALELESYQLASKHRAKFVKEVQLEQEQAVQQQTLQSSTKETSMPGDVLQQLVSALKDCCNDLKTSASSTSRRQTRKSSLVCWQCGQNGHRRAECPQRLGESKNSQPGNGQ